MPYRGIIPGDDEEWCLQLIAASWRECGVGFTELGEQTIARFEKTTYFLRGINPPPLKIF
jgi:hypothetical protein